MSRILITARTRINDRESCVGGIDFDTNRCIRLFSEQGDAFSPATVISVGTMYEAEYWPDRRHVPPHHEDVAVGPLEPFERRIDPYVLILERRKYLPVWEGNVPNLFDGCLSTDRVAQRFVASGAYVFEGDRLPSTSLGYWIPDRDLRTVTESDGKRYVYSIDPSGQTPTWRIRHTGYSTLPKIIPRGSILSLSLARWWSPRNDPDPRRRCTLQVCDLIGLRPGK